MTAPEIDPTQAASARLNRRVFVGISAAAAVAASTAPSGAQTLGGPHPPLVAESDPSIEHATVTLDRPGVALKAYAAWPVRAGTQTPAVVVAMHIWGVDTSIRDVVRRYAKAGFAAIAPDLYARLDAPSGDGATDFTVFRPYASRLDRALYVDDLAAGGAWLAGKFANSKPAITGFCMGGRLALISVVDRGDRFAAVAPFYGPLDGVDPKSVRVPVCGSYGGRDRSIPAAGVRAFAAALEVPNDFRIYDEAGHAFFDDQRPSYVASAAADAWRRTLAFFGKYLGESKS